jgi:16S rRNA (guanine966-N2)-methyltransferase
VRIVGGSLAGRVLRAPAGQSTRPTSEKVREAIFNILGSRTDFEGAHVLDMFAGSGAMGIEALSRGAAHATFIDKDKTALEVLRKNLAELALAEVTVLAQDAIAAVKRATAVPWRLVFVDPPYASDLAERAVLALPRESLANDARVVIEHDRRHVPPDALGSLLRTDQRRYGDTLVSFYEVPS